jgi:hypothetical protein
VIAAGCTATSRSSRCTNGSCTISLSGEQPVPVELGSLRRTLRVGPIESAAVPVAAGGDQARLPVGASQVVGGLAVTVTSVSGRDVGLVVVRD